MALGWGWMKWLKTTRADCETRHGCLHQTNYAVNQDVLLDKRSADQRASTGTLLRVRSLQHSLAIVVAGVAKTIVPVQPFP